MLSLSISSYSNNHCSQRKARDNKSHRISADIGTTTTNTMGLSLVMQTYCGIKGSLQGEKLKNDTAHCPNIRFEVVFHSLTELWGHVVWGAHQLENKEQKDVRHIPARSWFLDFTTHDSYYRPTKHFHCKSCLSCVYKKAENT